MKKKLNRKLKQGNQPPLPKNPSPSLYASEDPEKENKVMKLISENPYASVTILVSAIVTIVTYVLSLYGINLPAGVIAAGTAILSFLLGRWTRLSGEEAKKLEA